MKKDFSLNQFEAIFNSSPTGIHNYELNQNNQLIFKSFNSPSKKIFNVDHDTLLGKEIAQAFPNLFLDSSVQKYKQTAIDGSYFKKEIVEYKNEKIKRAFEVSSSQISQNKLAVFFNDITSIKKTENDLKVTLKRFKTIVDSILDLSRIEANKLEMNKSNCNVNQIVKQQVALFEGFALKKKIYLKYIQPMQDIYTFLDEQIFRQILNNLINNAIKYTLKGGVTLTCAAETKTNMNYVKIVIEDTGIGISKENLNIIFDEFRQVSEGFNRQFEGTGLGLTLTKRFVDLLNGTIKVESEVNRGSKFILLFPENIPASDIISEKYGMPEFFINNGTNGKQDLPKVLLVENDQYSSDVTRMFLKKICAIDVANTGEEAIEMAEENDYKIILMDINLGTGISGIEATKSLRSIKKYRQKPIIALTAFAMQGDKEEFIQSGCNDYLSKPFTKNSLQNVVNKYL